MTGIESVAIGIFGIFWMIGAASMGGGFVAMFGLVFVFIAISQAVYAFKNATSKNRYSAFDITDDNEETDPLNMKYGCTPSDTTKTNNTDNTEDQSQGSGNQFCPYCGIKLDSDFEFCNKCGRKLPQ